MNYKIDSLCNDAKALDDADKLSVYLDEFLLPQGTIYLDGNSLGPLTKQAKQRGAEVIEQQWGESLIAGWNSHQWINLPSIVGNKIAALIGAPSGSVICCDSISVNLFKILSGALVKQQAMDSKRNLILSQGDNFPTDLYMVQGLQTLLNSHSSDTGQQCEFVSSESHNIEKSIEKHGSRIAVLLLSHVNYKTGDIFDMQAITALAQKHGALVVWDLAHTAGAMPVELDDCKVDFAVGCSYKYLNGGPGAPGFVFAAKRHLASFTQPLSGWMGHCRPFEFDATYEKAQGIEQFLCGTPSIVSMSVLDAALDIFNELDIADVREKAIDMNRFFQSSVEAMMDDIKTKPDSNVSNISLCLACNENPAKRGNQISYAHPMAYAICQAMIEQGVIADFRAPDILRIGFSPLYLSFKNVFKAARVLCEVVSSERYLAPKYNEKQQVT